MADTETNKKAIQNFIQAVWVDRDLAALPDFWTGGCVNHAMPGPENRGIDALQAYHTAFFADFAAFSEVQIALVNQVAEADQVVTQIVTRGTQTGPFFGLPATGKAVSLSSIRIDRFENGKIAEHWSVADLMGLMQQLQA